MNEPKRHAARPGLYQRLDLLRSPRSAADAVLRRGSRVGSFVHDRVRRIYTGERPLDLDLTDNGINSDQGTAYEPAFYGLAKYVLRQVPLPGPLHFVDYGSGRARLLFAAQELGYASATGVEYSRELHEEAADNVARQRFYSSRTTQLRTVLCDAAAYQVDPLQNVFYFYNPFGASVMNEVLDQIEASRVLNPRSCWFVYLIPKHAELLDQRGYVEVPITDWRGIPIRAWLSETPDN